MTPSFYIISPVATDARFADKRAVVTRIAANFGLRAFYPLDDNKEFDLDSTLSIISAASFVVADLSFERPSCYYELGLVQAQRKDTILLAEADTTIHQSFAARGVRFYRSLDDYADILSDGISRILNVGGVAQVLEPGRRSRKRLKGKTRSSP